MESRFEGSTLADCKERALASRQAGMRRRARLALREKREKRERKREMRRRKTSCGDSERERWSKADRETDA